jgi:hypothetical protein
MRNLSCPFPVDNGKWEIAIMPFPGIPLGSMGIPLRLICIPGLDLSENKAASGEHSFSMSID